MQLAFKMKLFKGYEAEYKRRHDELWPALALLLKQAGISNYFIFLDETTNDLFSSFTINESAGTESLPHEAVMKKWWAFMKDIMETNEDNSPVAVPLQQVFYLP